MAYSVFAYGTLEIPEIMSTVTGQIFSSDEATAHNFDRYLLKGKIYPGMMIQEGASTDGRVYFELNECVLSILDEFEDDLYERTMISIRTTAGQSLEAFAYLLPKQCRDMLSVRQWNKDKFVAEHFGAYVQSCRTFYAQMLRKGTNG